MELRLTKMKAWIDDVVHYQLAFGDTQIDLNPLLGQPIQLTFLEKRQCYSCQKFFKKLFAQGLCYDCFSKVPEASPCVIRPELCEGHLNKGRDIEWEKAHHVQPHFVYLAVASSLKVGVTRATQIPTRWIDQGASYAIKLAEVPYRKLAGDIEVALKTTYTDKTNWRAMLKNEIGNFELEDEKWHTEEFLPADLAQYLSEDDTITTLRYPVLAFPQHVKSVSFDKTTVIEGKLMGIKGQYLLLDKDRVLNVRKHTGYYVDFQV